MITQRFSIRFLLVVTFLMPALARAQQPPDANAPAPRCGPAMDGQVICKFGEIYECQFIDPNSMERRTGWRWTADLLRSCAEPDPVTTGPQDSLPPGFTYAPQGGGANTAPQNGQTGYPGGQPYQGQPYQGQMYRGQMYRGQPYQGVPGQVP